MRRAALLLLSAALPACQAAAPPPACLVRPPGLVRPLGEAVPHKGESASLTFTWDSGLDCRNGGKAPRVDQVTVEILGPDNRDLAVVTTPPQRHLTYTGSDAWDVTVYFTAQTFGLYHAVVTFEPEGRLVQRDFWVPVDRRADLAVTATTPGTECARLEHTASGSLLCQQPNGGVVLFRDGVQRAVWPGATGRVAGEAIWLRTAADEFSRVTELADGGLETARAAMEVNATFAATQDAALLWLVDGARSVGLDAGALEVTNELRGPGLYVVALGYAPDAGTAVIATPSQWGRFHVAGESDVLVTRWTSGERAAWQAPDGVWVQSLTALASVRFVSADAARAPIDISPPQGWQPQSAFAAGRVLDGDAPLFFPIRGYNPDFSPALDQAEAVVPAVRDAALWLGHYVAPQGSHFVEVSGPWLRATQGDQHFFFRVDQD